MLHLVLTFTPHYIIMVKGLFHLLLPKAGFHLVEGKLLPKAGFHLVVGKLLPKAGFHLVVGKLLPKAGFHLVVGKLLPKAGFHLVEGKLLPKLIDRVPMAVTHFSAFSSESAFRGCSLITLIEDFICGIKYKLIEILKTNLAWHTHTH